MYRLRIFFSCVVLSAATFGCTVRSSSGGPNGQGGQGGQAGSAQEAGLDAQGGGAGQEAGLDAQGGQAGATGSDAGKDADANVDAGGWPAGLAAIVSQLATLSNGGTLDLGNGDTITTTVANGDRTQVLSQNGTTVLTVHIPASGPVTASGDLNGDGTADYSFNGSQQGSVVTQVESWDTDFDGTFDRRVTDVIDTTANTVTVTEEHYDLASSQWQTVSSYSGSASVEAGDAGDAGKCDGMKGFPSDTSGSSVSPIGMPNIRIVTNRTTGACSSAQALRIAGAFRAAVMNGLSCLDASDPALEAKLANAIDHFKLTIACGDHCSLGATDLRGEWRSYFGWQRMNLSTTLPSSDSDLQTLLLHEMLHWAGQAHVGGADGNGGKDLVYACSRYCTGCTTSSYTLGGGDAAYDCAACSDPAHKAACGTEIYTDFGSCPTAALCHAGLAGNAACSTCMNDVERNCDNTPQVGASSNFDCCMTCPSGYTSNDFPCGPLTPSVSQKCGRPASCP